MQTIQIVLEEDLLKAADREVKRLRTNRSRLFRLALREHLKRIRLKEDEDRERAAYAAIPEGDGMTAFEKVAAWPED
jgi:metal-responsive CopG/Arc/MetJ family transcriptional regulator